MRISMVAIGSTGDVRPYVLLGKELKKRGHEVTIVCFDMTEKMVTEAGLNFAPLAGSVKDIFMAVMTPGTNGFTFLPKFKNALLDDLLAVLGRPEPELELRVARQIILVPFGRIEYALAQNHYVSVRTGEGEYRATATFAPIQQSLCADPRLLLCKRGVVVNMDKVLRFESDAIQMLNGMSFPVRQKDKGRLFAAFTQYQFRHMRREL